MKIKVGNTIYDSDEEPVMVILTEQDKKNIANMTPEATKYCGWPDDQDWTPDAILKWMSDK